MERASQLIPELRKDFNARFHPSMYDRLLARMDRETRTHVGFRISESPCFFPAELIETMMEAGAELTHQLVDSPEYMRRSDAALPELYRVSNENPHPNFMTVDFGLVRDANGELVPKLVELQAFPSIYGYQAVLSRAMQEEYSLDPELHWFLSELNEDAYWTLLRQTIVGEQDPENVILVEIEPDQQKTLADFHATEDRLGIQTVDITHLVQQGNRLFYRRKGGRGDGLTPVRRIYNRAIVDELERKQVRLPFDYRADLEVEWAGHPNWYFRISKFSLPWLDHPTVPHSVFLSDWYEGKTSGLPEDRNQWVLKPLYSFAGKGIVFGPTQAELDAILPNEREQYLLQERVQFAPVIETPFGPTQAELRILYVWPEQGRLTPVLTLTRMGRGKMMGVDHNRDQQWVGSTAAYIL